jgi:hypothetical protein
MGMHDHFRRNFARDYELFLNTDLSPDIKIGTVGQIGWGKRFLEDGFPDLQKLGIPNVPTTDWGAKYDHDYEHQGDVNRAFDLKLSGSPATKYFAQAEAGVSLEFGRKWSYVVSVKGLRYQGLDMTEELMGELQRLTKLGKLRPQMKFVVGVWLAESVSWVLSLDTSSSIAIKASADIASMADLGINWVTVSKRGSVHRLSPHGEDSGVPIFFKLAHMRRNGRVGEKNELVSPVAPVYSDEIGIYEVLKPSEVLGADDD